MITRVRSTLAVFVAPLVLSCAAGGGGSSTLDGYSIRYRADARGYRYTFASPSDRIVEALPEVYRYLGFPGGLASSTNELLFISPTATTDGRIYNEEPNSLYMDCGTVLGGPRADSHILQFVIVTRIVPLESGGSEIEVIIDGLARQRSTNTNAVPCEGTGRLEDQVAALLRSLLAG